MTDTRPANPIASTSQALSAGPVISYATPLTGAYSPAHLWTMASLLALGLVVLADLVWIGSNYMEFRLLGRALVGEMGRDAMADNDARQQGIAVFSTVAGLIAGTIFLTWMARMNRNVRALTGVNLRFSPGAAVRWWFCPIANLYKPYQAMREIYVGSKSGIPGVYKVQSAKLVGVWWAFFILRRIGNEFVAVAFHVGPRRNISDLRIESWVIMCGAVPGMVAAILAMVMIFRTYQNQERLRLIVALTRR